MKIVILSVLATLAVASAAVAEIPLLPEGVYTQRSPTRIFQSNIVQAGMLQPVERKILQVYPFQERCAVQVPFTEGKVLTATFSEGYTAGTNPFFANFGRTVGRPSVVTATTGTPGEIVEAFESPIYTYEGAPSTPEEKVIENFSEKIERMSYLDRRHVKPNMTITVFLAEYKQDDAAVLKDRTWDFYAAEVSAQNISVDSNHKPTFDNVKVKLTYVNKNAKLLCPLLMSEEEINTAVLK